jgi:tripartite-type tricarboxylate transporter receptor subunit TctC
MRIPRRHFLNPAAGAAALPATSNISIAQAYPARPVTVVVPFQAGGALDVAPLDAHPASYPVLPA